MKKTFLWLTMLAIAGFVVGCELDNNKGRNLNFENASRHNVNVIPRTTEWGSFSLAPGETKKLEDIENPDFTWQPLSQVDVGSSSTDRNVIFVDRAPIYDPTEPIIIIQESE